MTQAIETIDRALKLEYLKRYPAEFVRELESRPRDSIAGAIRHLGTGPVVSIMERLSPAVAGRVIGQLDRDVSIRMLNNIDPNRGAAILNCLDEKPRRGILDDLDPVARKDVETALTYPVNTAGAMMDMRLTYYTPEMTVRQVLQGLRERRLPAVRVLFLVDDDRVLKGAVDVQDLALARKQETLGDLYNPVRVSIESLTSREEMVDIFERHRIAELPVVDFQGHLIGIVRHYSLINAALEENTLDLQTMVGVSKDERALSAPFVAVKKRLPWLQINLATAFLAAAVVGLFESTIAKYTALAVLLPVVAGQSGNTGAQALAVTMRGLALREIWPRHWPRLALKELSAGFWNGIAVAVTTSLGVYVWSRSPGLCLIIGISMVISMIIASVSGAMIPILLIKAGQDPASSSSIFLTTITDVMGFFSFLGIATLLMRLL